MHATVNLDEEKRLRALITGLNGFAGSHLADYLLAQPVVQVFGAGLGSRDNIAHLKGRVTFIEGNLTDLPFTEAVIAQAQPESAARAAPAIGAEARLARAPRSAPGCRNRHRSAPGSP